MDSSVTDLADIKITSIAEMKVKDEDDFIFTSSLDCTVQASKKNTNLGVLAIHNAPVLLKKYTSDSPRL